MKSSMGEMIFLDSSFLVAVEVEKDQNHDKAIKIRDRIINGDFGDVIVSDYVFDETITVTFQKTNDLDKAVLVGENLKNSGEIVYVDEEIFEESWDIFRKQENTKFSFTDCTILALMKRYGIKNLATFDGDFKKVKDIKVV